MDEMSATTFDMPWSPVYNISGILSACRSGGNLDAEQNFACSLACVAEEPTLEEAFAPWSQLRGERLPDTLWRSMCKASGSYTQAYSATLRSGRLFWTCCSQGEDHCEPGMYEQDGQRFSDVELLLQVVLDIAQATGLPDLTFNFNTGDQPFTDRDAWAPVPQFHWVSSASHWGVPMPTPFHLKALVAGRLGGAHERLSASHVPWDRRDGRVFWRGELSGPDHLFASSLGTLPRLQLQRLVLEFPELFDVGFTGVDEEMEVALGPDADGKAWKRVRRKLNIARHQDFRQVLQRYKYLINVSAVLSSWRLVELLTSGALLLLQEDSTREVLFDWLVPWEHFIPVRYDLGDLVPKLRWLQSHDDEARQIADRAFKRFALRVRREDTYCYVWRALRSVSAIAGPDPGAPGRGRGWREFTGREALAKDSRDLWARLTAERLEEPSSLEL